MFTRAGVLSGQWLRESVRFSVWQGGVSATHGSAMRPMSARDPERRRWLQDARSRGNLNTKVYRARQKCVQAPGGLTYLFVVFLSPQQALGCCRPERCRTRCPERSPLHVDAMAHWTRTLPAAWAPWCGKSKEGGDPDDGAADSRSLASCHQLSSRGLGP